MQVRRANCCWCVLCCRKTCLAGAGSVSILGTLGLSRLCLVEAVRQPPCKPSGAPKTAAVSDRVATPSALRPGPQVLFQDRARVQERHGLMPRYRASWGTCVGPHAGTRVGASCPQNGPKPAVLAEPALLRGLVRLGPQVGLQALCMEATQAGSAVAADDVPSVVAHGACMASC